MDFNLLIRAGILRKRQIDLGRVKMLLNFAKSNAKAAISIPLNENTSTIIFREIYESIRQLGDANWWLKGYEPLNHEISLDGLKELEIKEKVKLNYLPRFKKIRHDANYQGLRVSVSQAKEIIDFWNKCCNDIIKVINDKINKL
jgi:hypothetical protein